jgi:L-asparaginase II
MVSGGSAIGLALKIEDGDGGRRASPVATCEALRQIGFLGEAETAALEPYATPVVRDLPRGEAVGEHRPAFTLQTAGPG